MERKVRILLLGSEASFLSSQRPSPCAADEAASTSHVAQGTRRHELKEAKQAHAQRKTEVRKRGSAEARQQANANASLESKLTVLGTRMAAPFPPPPAHLPPLTFFFALPFFPFFALPSTGVPPTAGVDAPDPDGDGVVVPDVGPTGALTGVAGAGAGAGASTGAVDSAAGVAAREGGATGRVGRGARVRGGEVGAGVGRAGMGLEEVRVREEGVRWV